MLDRLTRWDLAAVPAFALFYFGSFRLSSPLNGPHEVFGQDSPHILLALGTDTPYGYNPQHHLLYHALTEWGYRLFRHGAPATVESAYTFLKVGTALTGAAFVLALLVLLAEIGLSMAQRFVLLLLAGVSVTAWFNFAGLETHGISLWAFAAVLTILVRASRDQTLSHRAAAALAGALAFATLCRSDNARLLPLAALPLLWPSLRPIRRRLVLAITLAAALAGAGTLLVGKLYFDVPLRDVPAKIASRHDRFDLRPKLARRDNLDAANLARMTAAEAVYTLVMPRRPKTFTAPLRTMLATPLSAAALASVLLVWARVLVPLAQGLRRGDLLLWVAVAAWVGSTLFFTWLNPVEPFLWLLELLPFNIAVVALTLRDADRPTWALLAATALLVAVHNTVGFYLVYDV